MNSVHKELFDVVDEYDEVIGTEARSVVHRERLWHRAVHIFIFNQQGELFLQRRSMTKDTAPGKWVSSCSGHVDSGERYDEAAIREVCEEIGLCRDVELQPVFKQSPCKQTGYEFVWLYECYDDGPFTLDPSEVMDGIWINTTHLKNWLKERPRDFAWSFSYLWSLYLDRSESK